MTQYVVMFPADSEAEWAAGSEADHQRTFDIDFEFGQRLQAVGGAVVGGAGLGDIDNTTTLTRGADGSAEVARAPYRPGDAQLSGFFIVTCDDYDSLVAAAEILTTVHPVVEIRACPDY